ncbi:hypothetical protein [Nocardia cyriacigeorgica]|nr:hypothetical protein [Nocardia cyriacigeorgica]MBF6439323.1 hypothetical protein [Nocardia cyriacigeorgica]MBF6455583.1 hypothetical protein [Nocardia cyriacigeorgica]MBF6479538.1 hypothetical protein [Nocardia cyriacigeorgica]MBF6553675.1 hypothetical protein [Nocardia cyriacigeorgica]NEW28236.1 hypothetical protein [Nocardia cyriacigeorgica]
MHPDTEAALEGGRAAVHAMDAMLERIDGIRARRPSPSGRVIPEVDGLGRLTDLYIAPGTIASTANPQELVADIMAAIRESALDAIRQHGIAVDEMRPPELPGRVPGESD